MNAAALKDAIRGRLWEVVNGRAFIQSATIAGSFLDARSLDGISDIDFIVVVDRLDASRFQSLQDACAEALRPLLRQAGYDFRLNPTLGPLKFNAPRLAVLHLMIYSQSAHVEHVIQSPFTCLDWQRSPAFRKRSLGECYPVFGLQPRHFFGARRGARDYLADLRAGVVSYRELICSDSDYCEEKRTQPMTVRDRHEFAYHVLRFLMLNLCKLLTRANATPSREQLLDEYFRLFPEGAAEFAALFRTLAHKKQAGDFSEEVPDLTKRLKVFVAAFEAQFRQLFEETATRHVVFRHAPTPLNAGNGEARVFQGKIDVAAAPGDDAAWGPLANAVRELSPRNAFCSPLTRSRQSLTWLGRFVETPLIHVDERLSEISYGLLEGLTVAEARAAQPELFAAWARKEDRRCPDGECYTNVLDRVQSFVADSWEHAANASVCCTHNVVLRCLIGATLGVPRADWHRLRIPHLAPITFVQTRDYGLFVDLLPEVERRVFADWASRKD